jgi:hypothetical protein
MSESTFAALETPVGVDPDPEEFIQAAMNWHFSSQTGAPFWLERAKNLDFDPRADVKTVEDLRLFPNIMGDLRDVSVTDLIPRGYGRDEIPGVYESGGTTGAPKRVLMFDDVADRVMAWLNIRADEHAVPRNTPWLAITPTGPHMVGHLLEQQARTRGGIPFTVDMDPRWVKKLIAAGKVDEVNGYIDHLIEQAAFVLRSQDVGVLVTTPPMLERLARNDELVDLINTKIRAVIWSGAHMDADTRYVFRTEVFPDAAFFGYYGSTMILDAAAERTGLGVDDPCVFDTHAPFVTFSVVDPETLRPVAYGERGQVVMNHVSKGMLMPNNLERDEATRVQPPPGQVGDSVADVSPLKTFEDTAVIEGVY